MTIFNNLYGVLGVDSKASKTQIQEAYHAKGTAARKALIWDNSDKVQKQINQLDTAYRILYSHTTRADYDKFLKTITWNYRLNKIRKIFYIPTPSEIATAFLLLVAGLRYFQFA